MIENEALAKQVSLMILDAGARLDHSTRLAQANCSEVEFDTYRRAVGRVMFEMYHVLQPLYLRHPSLKPKGIW